MVRMVVPFYYYPEQVDLREGKAFLIEDGPGDIIPSAKMSSQKQRG